MVHLATFKTYNSQGYSLRMWLERRPNPNVNLYFQLKIYLSYKYIIIIEIQIQLSDYMYMNHVVSKVSSEVGYLKIFYQLIQSLSSQLILGED